MTSALTAAPIAVSAPAPSQGASAHGAPPTTPAITAARAHGLRLLPAPSCDPPYDDEPAAPHLRLVRSAPLRPLPADTLTRTPRSDLPDARRTAYALVQGLLEVSAGTRPVSQLQRDTTPELFAQLEQVLAPRRRGAVLRSGARPAAAAPLSRTLRSLHVQERPDGVAEVCATVHRSGRAGAVALRLEGQRGRWVCTAVAGL